MIEINGVKLRTRCQWEKRHRHVRKNARGIERTWRSPIGDESATFYAEAQTRPWNKRELRAAARERAEKRARDHDERIRAEAEAKGRAEAEDELLRACCGKPIGNESHTAWQWISMGFVPIAEARWRTGDPCIGQSTDYCYCEAFDVRWKPKLAAKLKESGPRTYDELPDGRPYNGCPWW